MKTSPDGTIESVYPTYTRTEDFAEFECQHCGTRNGTNVFIRPDDARVVICGQCYEESPE